MRYSKLLLASLSLAVAACASSGSGGAPGASTAISSSGVPNTLMAAEVEKANVPTAYEAVDRLRRKWWKDVTAPSGSEVAVYMDNKKYGAKESLRDIPSQDIAWLEYFKGSEAVMKFGQEAAGGAIIIHRK